MNVGTERLVIEGPAGAIEVARDVPSGGAQGVALIAHPHPLFGGTLDNKVVQTVARAAVQKGWTAIRFNFRGVQGSAGTYDEGRGELADWQAVMQAFAPTGPLCVAGFSFGAFVSCGALAALSAQSRDVQHAVLVGTATTRFPVDAVPDRWRERTLVVHGESDDTVPLSDVMNWARPQSLPVTVVPAVAHFFHGQLPLLKALVARHLEAPRAAHGG